MDTPVEICGARVVASVREAPTQIIRDKIKSHHSTFRASSNAATATHRGPETHPDEDGKDSLSTPLKKFKIWRAVYN